MKAYHRFMVWAGMLFTSMGVSFGQTVSLDGAITGALEGIHQKAPLGAVVAVAQFQADSPKLSDYVLGELSGGLVNRGQVKVVERQQINMDLVTKSLAFDMTGAVSDESAQFIGHFLGAQYLVLGSMMDVGNGYRFRVEMVQVETAEKVQSYTATIDKGDRQVYALTDEGYAKGSTGRTGPSGSGTRTTSDTGIWVGIVSFGPTAEDLTGGRPVFLDRTGLETLQGILDSKYQKSRRQGTALYYGVHRALAALSDNAGQFPDNLDSVNVLTFTDGLDNGSTNLMLPPLEGQDFGGGDVRKYQGYLEVQIKNRPVRGRSITAFSAGVRGSDVNDGKRFSGALQSLASSPEHFYELANFSQLNEKFGKIADELVITKTNTTFRLVTPGYAPGTKIRMTFDGAVSAEGSKRYLEGTVRVDRQQRAYVLQEIRYEGVSSSAGPQVKAMMDGMEVIYVFEDFLGYEGGTGVKQWSQEGGTGNWQVNSEYRLGESVKTSTEYKSAVVYLALDCSTSLSDRDIQAIREAAKGFVRTLYEKSRRGSAEARGTLVVETAFGGTVKVSGNEVDQQVSIRAGQPWSGTYGAGTYTVRVQYEDGKEETRSVSLRGEEEVTAAFTYRPVVQGALVVEAATGGTVSITGNGEIGRAHV
jgi:TolB-like protein